MMRVGSLANWIEFTYEDSGRCVTYQDSHLASSHGDEVQWGEDQLFDFWDMHEQEFWEGVYRDGCHEHEEWGVQLRLMARAKKRKGLARKRGCRGSRTPMSYWRCKSQMTAREVAQHERILDNRLAHPQRGRYEKKAIYADAEEGKWWTGVEARAMEDEWWTGVETRAMEDEWRTGVGDAALFPPVPNIPKCPANNTVLPDKLFELMHNLQFRDIDPNDFDLLMELADYDSKKTASEKQLAGIPSFCASADICEECNEGCIFCAEIYEVGQTLKRLPCGHVFHELCLAQHLSKYSTKCPFNTGVAFGGCDFEFV